MRKDSSFMGTARRLSRVVDRRVSMPGWRPWLTTALVALVMSSLILVTTALVGMLPGPKDVQTVGGVLAGFFSYWAAWVVVGWLHVKRLRWVTRAMYRKV